MLVAYVTGHGYGHATRTAEVLREVRVRRPDLPIRVVTMAPPRLFTTTVEAPLTVIPIPTDVGVAQRGALVLDEKATADAWESFMATHAQRLRDEVERLRGAQLVFGDVPPLAFEAAATAGVPSVALGNFSWDWIWRHLARHEPRLHVAADAAARAYAKADLLLELPFAGDLDAFRERERIPLVARRPTRHAADVRRHMGVAADATVVLLSFGGLGLDGIEAGKLGRMAGFHFLVQDTAVPGRNVTTFGNAQLDRLGIGYQDLVGASDVVVSKPGYGIVTDCIAARTRLLYTDRGDFPEYPVMVEEMPRYLPARHVGQEALFAADLDEDLRHLLSMDWPESPRLDGAEVAAERLLALGRL